MGKSICDKNCDYFNELYKKLNNSNNEILFYKLSSESLDNATKKKLINMVKTNWDDIKFYLNKINEVAIYLQNNKNFEGTEFMELINEIIESYKKIKTVNSFMKIASKIIQKRNIYILVKQFVYILCNKKRCKFLVESDLRSKQLNKSYIRDIIDIVGTNINLVKMFIFNKYEGNHNKWSHKQYESAYEMFKTLLIIEKYYEHPLKLLKIKYSLSKPYPLDKILENLEINYVIETKKNNLNQKNIKTISEFIILMKQSGFDLWFTIDFIMKNIYSQYSIENTNIKNFNIEGNSNVENQKNNNLLAIKIYLLCKKGFITNSNIFQNFVI